MAMKRIVLELGMGTDIRGGDSTKAAVRALKDALWHNSLTVSGLTGQDSDEMWVKVRIGVPAPETVDVAQVLAVLPHGAGEVEAVEGGLRIPKPGSDDVTLLAHAAAIVYLDVPAEAHP